MFETVIILITLIVLFSYLAENINIPYPIVLLILGLVLGYSGKMPNFTIPRELILPMFLPPILFWGAMSTNWYAFKKHWLAISSLGILLVLVTSLLVAVVVDYLCPGLGFVSALLLGAVVSPSDAVCATAVLSRLGLPARLISILEGESLINDAAGIVLFDLALSTLLYNKDIFAHPVLDFLELAVGGVTLGAIAGSLFAFIFFHVSHKKETSLSVIVSLVIPYVIYHIATHIGVSNVLAVVSAGMCMRLLGDRKMDARTRLQGVPVWDTLIFILNGLIFILLGLEFPRVISRAMSVIPLASLLELTVAVLACIILVRVIWVYASAKVFHSAESARENLLIAWSGMRGIVSLALALSIPFVPSTTLTYHHGDVVLFITREVILFVTVITILFTIIVQGLSLPWLVRRLKIKSNADENDIVLMDIFAKLTQKTIRRIQKEEEFGDVEHLKEAKSYMLDHYRTRLQYHKIKSSLHALDSENSIPKKAQFHKVLSRYHRYERAQLRALYKKGLIDMEVFSRLMHYLDMEETRHI